MTSPQSICIQLRPREEALAVCYLWMQQLADFTDRCFQTIPETTEFLIQVVHIFRFLKEKSVLTAQLENERKKES